MEEKRIDFVQRLPMEVIEEIFLYLKPCDLASCTAVSISWREAVNSNKIWGYLCDRKGWKDDFDPRFSHFCQAHKQFRRWYIHSCNSFSPICQKRLMYNKHSYLQNNWMCGKHVVHEITNGPSTHIQLFEPVTCDGKHLVMMEKSHKDSILSVWSLDGIPSRLCVLPLPNKVQPVDATAFDHETIAVVQEWVIIVYTMQDGTFKIAYEKHDLTKLAPKDTVLKNRGAIVPYLKVTQDYVICVPNQSQSTEGNVPIFFWQRSTGELVKELSFDSMYYSITNAVWYSDSCYLSLTNKKIKSYQIVEFGLKSTNWEFFSQNVTALIEQIAVSNDYIVAVTKNNSGTYQDFFTARSENNKELWLWDRTTGSALKTLEVSGKSFQFVDEKLMFFDSCRVKVMEPLDPTICSEFEVNGTISSIKACTHSSPSLMVVIKTESYIEVWDWGKGSRLYTITAETGYGSQLWCDDKRIITYHSESDRPRQNGGIMILGFW